MINYEANEENEKSGENAWELDPFEMLREDHRKVQGLFQLFEEAENLESKREVAAETIKELKIHAAIEEEIFYPTVRRETGENDLLDEAAEEHHVAKLLIAELEEMGVEDERYDAKYKVLAESVKHHIQEEESEMFPRAAQADIAELGGEMHARKQELMQEYEQGSTGKRSGKRPAKKSTAAARRKSKR